MKWRVNNNEEFMSVRYPDCSLFEPLSCQGYPQCWHINVLDTFIWIVFCLFVKCIWDQPMLYILKANSFSLSSGCDCNNHAQRCHFDQALYEASGRRSGGVCEGCMHHTTGPKCEQCAPGYQPNPYSRMDRPDACIRKCSISKCHLSFKSGPSYTTAEKMQHIKM